MGKAWGLQQLQEIAENNRAQENMSLEAATQALRSVAGNKPRMTLDKLIQFFSEEKDLDANTSEKALKEILSGLGLEVKQSYDCEDLAEKLLKGICAPPLSFQSTR